MTREQAAALVNSAIDQLVQNDSALLDLRVTERSLSYRLAHYMALSEAIRPPLTVDCEYNRHFGDPKRLKLPPRNALDRGIRAATVFPDILVHERNTDANNIVVLELKKPGEDAAYDELKLQAFREELGYVHTAHVILGYAADGALVREVIWVDD
ncbi:hypothetical protein [Stenotrophomonas sp. SAU14A_NAIMI4_8]|uniref:hypothetical protein n=1 Tax=Stenotrophomonas sp. SAU14A_NAIMI4_8 TaxID=2072409 RepID=UPI000D53C624|nr:hypothetical protein [Stenotrophomonas sp. SAU14A_NAIMI4_8]AWH31466.1 hypothetical protein C1930_00570 [Stenotrophomonas sp. SAU14A_NAIMI4_8]